MIGLKSLIRRVRIKLIECIARGDNMAVLSATRGLSIVALPMNGPTSAECLLLDRRINGLITVNAPVLCDLPNGRARVLIGAGAGSASSQNMARGPFNPACPCSHPSASTSI